MKKIFLAICIITLLCVNASYAAESDEQDILYVGFLNHLMTTEEEFYGIIKNSWSTKGWSILGGNHDVDAAKFYDSLISMQMALNSGEIDEMILPDFVAEYLMKTNSNYMPSCISNSGTMGLCFGFMNDRKDLAQRWNEALRMIRNEWILSGLVQKYIKDFQKNNSFYDSKSKKERIKFEHFQDAQTIKVAVTGDMPPLDFIGEDGLPTGFNIAVLAEIGRRLKVNIEIVTLNANARTAALVSGRADVVFWYEVNTSLGKQFDVPDDVILSDPYYEWNQFFHIRLK